MKSLPLLAALAPAVLFAQTHIIAADPQQPRWVAIPANPSPAMSSHVSRPDGQTGPVTGKPFTGVEKRSSTQILSGSTIIHQEEQSNFFRDTQGRMRTENELRIIINDPVAHATYTLNPKNKTYMKVGHGANTATTIAVSGGTVYTHTTDASKAGTIPHSSSQPLVEDLPPETIDGLFCRGSRVTTIVPAGAIGNNRDLKIVNERWYSDDLQVLVKSVNNDPRFGETIYQLTGIVQGPQNPALFQVPADYKEGYR